MKTKQLLLTSAALVLSTTLAAYADDASYTTATTTTTSVTILDGMYGTEHSETYDLTDNTANSVVADSLNSSGSTNTTVGNQTTGTTTLVQGATTNITGTAVGVTGATTINTSGAADSTIGAVGNSTSILSSTVSIGTGNYDTAVAIGGTNAGTTVVATAGDASTVLAQDGDTRWVTDANGKLVSTNDTTSGTTAALVVTNSASNTHGIVVEETKTTISGGLNSSSLTLNDLGATFSDSATGAPIQVHGVADGTADFDATNVRQVYSGLAAVLAATPELRLEPGKTGVGVGLGSYGGFNAVGIGFGHMYDNGAVLTGAVSKAPESEVAYKASVSWTW